MLILTYIARQSDGLLLVASMDSSSTDSNQEVLKKQAKQLIRNLDARSASKCSVDATAHAFHYIIDHGIVYLTLTDKSYPKRLAFLFLEELKDEFESQLQAEHGQGWLKHVETVGRAYAFIKFDKTIQRKRREYSDPNSSTNMRKMQEDLQDVQSIMRKSINDMLDRGGKLDEVSEISGKLSSESKKYKWGAKQLSLMAMYKQYLPLAIVVGIGLLLLIILYFR